MTEYIERGNILKKMIESLIIPKYPTIEEIIITNSFFRGMTRYGVLVLTKKNDYSAERKIGEEIETLFKMASFNEKQINGRDYVDVSFA